MAALHVKIPFYDPLVPDGKSAIRHGGEECLVTGARRIKAARAGDKGDASVPKGMEMSDRFRRTTVVVDEDVVKLGSRAILVHEDERDLLPVGKVKHLAVRLRRKNSDAIDVAVDHALDALLKAIGLVIRVREDDIDVALPGASLKVVNKLRKERVVDVGDDEPEELGATRAEITSASVGNVVQLGDDLPHMLGGRRANLGRGIQHARHSSAGNIGATGYFLNVHRLRL